MCSHSAVDVLGGGVNSRLRKNLSERSRKHLPIYRLTINGQESSDCNVDQFRELYLRVIRFNAASREF